MFLQAARDGRINGARGALGTMNVQVRMSADALVMLCVRRAVSGAPLQLPAMRSTSTMLLPAGTRHYLRLRLLCNKLVVYLRVLCMLQCAGLPE
jgi:hypothetical protein